jgi:hypothetical protein
MNNQYTPDRWILIQIESAKVGKITKILSGWYGGYLNGDSWRLSSGVTKIEEKDTHYLIHNESGSIYTCYKNNEGVSGLTGNILYNWQEQAKDRDGVTVKEISIDEYTGDLK